MDDHFRFGLRIFHDPVDGTQHVPYFPKIKKADEAILRDEMDRPAWISRPLLFHLRRGHVPRKKDTRQTRLDGKAQKIMNIEQGTRNFEVEAQNSLFIFHCSPFVIPSLFNIPCSLFDIPSGAAFTACRLS